GREARLRSRSRRAAGLEEPDDPGLSAQGAGRQAEERADHGRRGGEVLPGPRARLPPARAGAGEPDPGQGPGPGRQGRGRGPPPAPAGRQGIPRAGAAALAGRGLEGAGRRPHLLRSPEHRAAEAPGRGGLRLEGGGRRLGAGGQRQGVPCAAADAAASGVHPTPRRGERRDQAADLARPPRYETGGDGGPDATEAEGADLRGSAGQGDRGEEAMKRAALLLLLLGAPAQARVVEKIAAVVGDDIVLSSEVEEHAAPFMQEIAAIPNTAQRATRAAALRREVLDRLVDERLIIQQAAELKLTVSSEDIDRSIEQIKRENGGLTDAQLSAELTRAGQSMASYRQEIKKQILRYRVLNIAVGSK